MKKLSLEKQIYFCKYHNVDTKLHFTIGICDDEIEPLVQKFKREGLYEKYRDMTEEEYERAINEDKNLKKI